jgi:hypothetical protein
MRIKMPANTKKSLENIWQIAPGADADTLYVGVAPAALFESHDRGETWKLNSGLWKHPHRKKWSPGFGGLCLHTVVTDQKNPNDIKIAISTGGVYQSADGGENWQVTNTGVKAYFLPNQYPEFGQCVHKIAMHPARPERLFLQNHWGLYRSDDSSENWKDIANGVPSDFGFAMVMHPRNPDCVYIVPVESDQFRCSCDGRLRVYRTRNGGASWEPLARGLPQKQAYETVLRDAMTVDSLDPAGIYFGTRSGQLFGSCDEGKTWNKILEGLPAIVCVQSAIIEDGFGHSIAAPRGAPQPAPSSRSKSRTSSQSRRKKR